MFLLSTIFFTVIGSILMIAALGFAAFTLLGVLVLYSYMVDKKLTLKEKASLGFLMVLLLAWAVWLTQFTYHLGASCLTN